MSRPFYIFLPYFFFCSGDTAFFLSKTTNCAKIQAAVKHTVSPVAVIGTAVSCAVIIHFHHSSQIPIISLTSLSAIFTAPTRISMLKISSPI